MVKKIDQSIDMEVRQVQATAIVKEIKERNLRHIDVHNMTGVMRAHVSFIVAGRLERFSVSRLLGILDRLGATVNIDVQRSAAAKATIERNDPCPTPQKTLLNIIASADGSLTTDELVNALSRDGYCSPEIERAIRRCVERGDIVLSDGLVFLKSSEKYTEPVLTDLAA